MEIRVGQSHRVKHLFRIAAMAAVIVFFSALPFLQGRHFDGALTLSLLAQVLSILLIPAGLLWLMYRRWKRKEFRPLPLYLLLASTVALTAQIALSAPLTKHSRDIAIKNSAEIVSDIETYRADNGRYPTSLFAVWPDYSPGVIGIAQYYYEPQGEGYNLIFEQPRFLLDELGARELVAYNPRDEHAVTSHAAWRLSQPELEGWFAAHDIGIPHWKYFLFD